MKFTPDSNLLIIAKSTVGSLNGFSKIDLNGNNIWNKTGILSNSIGDAAGDSAGNTYLINGEYVISNSGSVIQKLAPNGTLLWNDTNSITAFRVEVGNDNHPVICGFPNSGLPGAAFIKYNSSGTILWQNLDADGPLLALLLHAQMKMDSTNASYLAAGTLTEMALCKVSSNGISEWTTTIPGSYANAFDFETKNVIYIVGGTTAKIGQSITTSLSSPLSGKKNEMIHVYPNPFTNTTTIEFNLEEIKNNSLSIIDVTGRMVENISQQYFTAGENKINIDLSNLQNGIYFCILQTNHNLQVSKLIKN
ncbi:MAG: T9SS type A sorting domain-containing protein [Bacteroidetes bacterium]|nr:T9SS type A sorting domain-containing protein [Bacteroidota bacterium]